MEEPQKPHMLQHLPNLEPAQVWPVREPQTPLVLTLDVGAGFVAGAEVAVVFTVEEEVVAMLEAAEDAFTVELVSVDPPVVTPVLA